MSLKVLSYPHVKQTNGQSGVGQVVENYFRYLPQFDIELVSPQAASYDIRVSHAGSVSDAEVAHCHGLYWTADYAAAMQEYATNSHVIQALRTARQVTVPSSWVAENIARDMRFLPQVVPHGINFDEWQHSFSSEGYVLWNKNRTTDVCDNTVLGQLGSRLPDINFLTTFSPHNATPNVHSIGTMPHKDMIPYIQKCGVYLANVKETFGIGILEAMASGRPILGYAHGGILDIVEHGAHGYLAEPGNIEDLADGLLYCIQYADILGANAREHAANFTWEAVCKQVADIYRAATQVEPPACSIVIPSYRYADKVSYAIASAQKQDYPLLKEIIVVDDGSDDEGATEQVVTTISQSDPRVRYIRQSNSGVAIARNTGIAQSASKYISCLDADDEIEPEFLSTLIPSLEADPTLGVAYSAILLVKSDRHAVKSRWPGNYNYDQQVQGHNQVPTCCVFRREMWKRLGGYRQRYSPMGAGAEDAEFWLRAGSIGYNGKLATPKPLFIYSFQTGATSDPSYHEVNWLAWHPWAYDGNKHPFASLATPMDSKPSHAVRQYDQPEISVIIPVGPGHEHLLIDALDSLEAQSFHKWEAIVVNDTGNPLELPGYPYVTIIDTHGQRGPGYARNRGIEASRASLFLCLDADDYLQFTALSDFMGAHDANPSAWIYSDMYLLKSNGIIEEFYAHDWNVHVLWRKGIAPVTCLYPKSMWEEVGGFDEAAGREDWDFHLRLARAGYCGIRLPKILLTYRHDTGKRRNEDNIRRENARLKTIYSEEELQMACSSCGKKRAAVPKPTNWILKEKEDMTTGQWPLLQFVGKATSDILFKGRTGRGYMFANNTHNRYHRVHPDDAEMLSRSAYLVEVDSVPEEMRNGQDRTLVASPAPSVPQIEKKPAPPSPPAAMIKANPNDVVKVEEPVIPMPDFDVVGKDYDVAIASPVDTPSTDVPSTDVTPVDDAPVDDAPDEQSIDAQSMTVADIVNRDWTLPETRSIYTQELASDKPRVTITRWAEKEIEKSNSE